MRGDAAGVRLVPVGPQAAALLAELHHLCLGQQWQADSVARLLALPGGFALIAEGAEGAPAGFVLCLSASPAIDLAAIGVVPERRRTGVADRLLAAAIETARAAGAEALMLEVAEDNRAAVALYAKHGFLPASRRASYYHRPDGRYDAIVMRLDLAAATPAPGG